MLAVDLDGRVESWNTQLEALDRRAAQEAVGRKLEEVLPADLVAEIAARADDERVSSLYKFPMRNRAGRNLVVNVSIAPLVGKSGERIGRLILVDDITQRMRLEEQLLQTEKLTSLGLLAAGRGARGEHAAGRDLQLHSDAGEATSQRRSAPHS